MYTKGTTDLDSPMRTMKRGRLFSRYMHISLVKQTEIDNETITLCSTLPVF